MQPRVLQRLRGVASQTWDMKTTRSFGFPQDGHPQVSLRPSGGGSPGLPSVIPAEWTDFFPEEASICPFTLPPPGAEALLGQAAEVSEVTVTPNQTDIRNTGSDTEGERTFRKHCGAFSGSHWGCWKFAWNWMRPVGFPARLPLEEHHGGDHNTNVLEAQRKQN